MFDTASNTDGTVLEAGQYVLTVESTEQAEDNGFGPSVLWRFRVSDPTTPEEFRLDDSGEPYLFWHWTSTKMTPRARARHWIEALLGRPIGDGERIDPSTLVGKRMTALVIHEEKEGQIRAKISMEVRPKPYGQPAAGGTAAPPKSAPATATNGAAAGGLSTEWAKAVRKAELLEVEGVGTFKAIDPNLFGEQELRAKLRELQRLIAAA